MPKNFTLEQLKGNYKRLALQLHPDKNLVSREQAAEIFKILTSSYKELLRVHEMRESDRTFDELRSSARRHYEDTRETSAAAGPTRTKAFAAQDGGFDAARFNTFFSEHRMQDPVADRGYGDWMRSSGGEKQVHGRSQGPPKECKSLMLHVDALSLGKSKLAFSQMGLEEVDDYSIAHTSNKSVGATDLRLAYSAQAEEEEEAPSRRREYRNVEDLKRDRAKISFTMNDSDAHAYEKYQHWQERQEAARLGTVRRVDVAAERHHDRVQNLLMAAIR